jgi:hypothetical protein
LNRTLAESEVAIGVESGKYAGNTGKYGKYGVTQKYGVKKYGVIRKYARKYGVRNTQKYARNTGSRNTGSGLSL